MQTVLHCKNSNKEGHIHHLLLERESQEDGWMMTQDLAEFKSPPHSSFCRCCQGGHTLCRLLSCHISHVPMIAALHLSSPVTCKVTWGAEFLSNRVCWAMGSIKLTGGSFYCWSLCIKEKEEYQHGGNEGKLGGQTWFQCDLKEYSSWITI